MMVEFEYLLRLYDTWLEERQNMSEMDGLPDGPQSKDWQRSDNFAFALLDDFVAKARGET